MLKVQMVESRGTSGNSEVLLSSEMFADFAFFIESSSSKKQTSIPQKFFFLPKKVRGFIIWVGRGAKREKIFEKL